MPTVYKIISQSDWATACEEKKFTGAEIDLADGYIHLSTAKQVRETASRHFAGRDDLLLLSVDSERFGDDMKWEPSRGGDLFPHLYGILSVQDVEKADSLPLDDLGNHVFPNDVPE